MSFTCSSCSLTASSRGRVKPHEKVTFAFLAAALGTAPGSRVHPESPSFPGCRDPAGPGAPPHVRGEGSGPAPPAGEGRWRRPEGGPRTRGRRPARASTPRPLCGGVLGRREFRASVPVLVVTIVPGRCGERSYSSAVARSDLPGASHRRGSPGSEACRASGSDLVPWFFSPGVGSRLRLGDFRVSVQSPVLRVPRHRPRPPPRGEDVQCAHPRRAPLRVQALNAHSWGPTLRAPAVSSPGFHLRSPDPLPPAPGADEPSATAPIISCRPSKQKAREERRGCAGRPSCRNS